MNNVISGLIIFSVVSFCNALSAKDKTSYDAFYDYSTVLKTIEKNYVSNYSKDELIKLSSSGLMRELDPFSTYLSKNKLKYFIKRTNGSFNGIGCTFKNNPIGLQIVSIIKDSPAEKVGLKPNDIITKVNSNRLEGIPLSEGVTLFNGRPSKIITIVVKSKNKFFKKTIKIKKINLSKIKISKFDEYNKIEIPLFYKGVTKAVRRFLLKNNKPVVIDLRGNPGGLLDEGIELADLFLSNGPLIQIETRVKEKFKQNNEADPFYLKHRLIVLVDRSTASSSEIFTAAIKDYNRGLIVGDRTYGKGTIQGTFNLPNKDALKMTIAEFKTPKNIKIHGKGISPNIVTDFKLKNEQELLLNQLSKSK